MSVSDGVLPAPRSLACISLGLGYSLCSASAASLLTVVADVEFFLQTLSTLPPDIETSMIIWKDVADGINGCLAERHSRRGQDLDAAIL